MTGYLCSMVRRNESNETCDGNCDHVDGKQYIVEYEVEGKKVKKTYTCVKVPRSAPFPIWSDRVNKIMGQ